MTQKSKEKFVQISDLHFNEKNLELSSIALSNALYYAEIANIPLVISGDLNDTKAIIRAEVANALIEILGGCKVPVFILMGNHDMINERGKTHGLNYLSPHAYVVDFPCKYDELPGVLFIPYQNEPQYFASILRQKAKKGDIIIMHQGVLGADMGDYIQDKTAISVDVVKNFVCFSGHYHKHHAVGTVTYAGNPFTMSFGEAKDGPKGFLVVNEDGTFKQKVLNLRKHVIYNLSATVDFGEELKHDTHQSDLIWIKIEGVKSDLDKISKEYLAELIGTQNFKLDKIAVEHKIKATPKVLETDNQILDRIIDNLEGVDAQELKALWRELLK